MERIYKGRTNPDSSAPSCSISCRRVLNIMVFLGFMVNYMVRVNLTFAIVDMIQMSTTNTSKIVEILPPPILNRTRRNIITEKFVSQVPDKFNTSSSTDIKINHQPVAIKVVNITKVTSSEEYFEEDDIYYYSDEYTYRTSSEEAQDNNITSNAYSIEEETTPMPKNKTNPLKPDFIDRNKSIIDFRHLEKNNSEINFTKTTENSLSDQINTANISKLYINRVVNENGKSNNSNDSQDVVTTTKNYYPSTEKLSMDLERTLNPKLSLGTFNNKRIASSFSKMTSFGTKSTGTTDDAYHKNKDRNISEHFGDSDVIFTNEPTEGNEILSDSLISNETSLDESPITDSSAAAAEIQDTDVQYVDEKGTVRFGWTEAQKGYLIGSFFVGYVCTEIPGGRLSETIGPRKVFGYAMAGASFVTLLTPFFAKIGLNYVIVLRVILGLFIGPTWPAVLPLAAKWIPPNERGKFMSNMMGSTLGAAITTPMCGFIISAFNWEYVFYVTGLIGIVWSVFWFLLVFDSPRQHPRITKKERRYIESKLAEEFCIPLKCLNDTDHNNSDEEELQQQNNLTKTNGIEEESNEVTDVMEEGSNEETIGIGEESNEKQKLKNKRVDEETEEYKKEKEHEKEQEIPEKEIPTRDNKLSLLTKQNSKNNIQRSQSDTSVSKVSTKINTHPSAPWFKIITSIPVWAFVLTHTASIFGYNTIINQLPTYASNILHYNIKQNGFVSALPYLGKYIMALTAGSLADSLLKSGRLSKTATKKLFTGFGVMIPGILMIFQVYLGQHDVIAIAIFTFSLTANGMITGGYLGNSLDLAPNYSGTIFGLGNMCSSSTGGISALLVGYLTTKNPEDFSNWQIVFWITGIIYICGSLIFIFFGTTDVQPWNSSPNKKVSTSQPVKSL